MNKSCVRATQVVSALLVAVTLAGCDSMGTRRLPPGTPPERNDWYGEFYNEREYAECVAKDREGKRRPPNDITCEYQRLTRVEEPEYWPYPNVPRPKLPEPPNPPVYRWGMSSKEYFDALCKAEAGEFIYRTVENVEGFYQIRPRKSAIAFGEPLNDRYVMEDPYGHTEWEADEAASIFLTVNTKRRELPYAFFEAPPRNANFPAYRARSYQPSMLLAPTQGSVIERYFDIDARNDSATMQKEFDTKLKSSYGFTWRGIKRPHDREMGIAGGELIVVDLQTGEILGIRRGFSRSGSARTRSGINWESAAVCPRLRYSPGGFDKGGDFSRWFIQKVLKPVEANRYQSERN
ncbi:MAG: hypothetical protein ACKVQT_23845 [Burkholderiales bacterium]